MFWVANRISNENTLVCETWSSRLLAADLEIAGAISGFAAGALISVSKAEV
jgi:hypothetical protein